MPQPQSYVPEEIVGAKQIPELGPRHRFVTRAEARAWSEYQGLIRACALVLQAHRQYSDPERLESSATRLAYQIEMLIDLGFLEWNGLEVYVQHAAWMGIDFDDPWDELVETEPSQRLHIEWDRSLVDTEGMTADQEIEYFGSAVASDQDFELQLPVRIDTPFCEPLVPLVPLVSVPLEIRPFAKGVEDLTEDEQGLYVRAPVSLDSLPWESMDVPHDAPAVRTEPPIPIKPRETPAHIVSEDSPGPAEEPIRFPDRRPTAPNPDPIQTPEEALSGGDSLDESVFGDQSPDAFEVFPQEGEGEEFSFGPFRERARAAERQSLNPDSFGKDDQETGLD